MPGDALPPGQDDGWTAELFDGREVLFGDGKWRWVGILAWRHDTRGRLCFLGEWSTPGDRGGPLAGVVRRRAGQAPGCR